MATINLGAIKFNWKGAYNNSTAYVVDDVVSSGGSSYVCILASQGNAVSNGTYWNVMAQAGTDGTDVGTTLTTQGDILYRDGSGLQRLAAGTSGQFLKTQGSGANPVWGTVTSKVVAHSYAENGDTYNNTNTSSDVTATNYTITHTPQSASNILLIEFMPNVRHNSGGGDTNFSYVITRTIGGTTTDFFTNGSDADYWYDSSGGNRLQFMRYYQFRDNTHNTTSAITYGVRFRNPHSTELISISNSAGISRWGIWELEP